MQPDRVPKHGELVSADDFDSLWDVEYQKQQVDEVVLRPPPSYREAFGGEPIRLGIVEFRIMRFLASRPYHAFTRRQISEATSTTSHPVSEESVDRHIASLHEQLGVLHDFVQSVPQVGYRFKA